MRVIRESINKWQLGFELDCWLFGPSIYTLDAENYPSAQLSDSQTKPFFLLTILCLSVTVQCPPYKISWKKLLYMWQHYFMLQLPKKAQFSMPRYANLF